MKRTAIALFALFVSAAAFAQNTQRYLIATRHAFRENALRESLRGLRDDVSPRAVSGFDTFRGYAADLTEAEAAALRRSPEVRWIEPVVERHALDLGEPVMQQAGVQTVPYGINLVHAPEAWTGQRSGEVNVVVIDTGIDFRHPDLSAVYAGGTNFINASATPMDDNGHGTHVSGTIAAADNNFGVVGIAPQVRLWAVKILNGQGSGSSENVVKGLEWVSAKKRALGGNWIVNLSLGSSQQSAAEREVFQRVADEGVLIIAASGNDSTATEPAPVLFPAAYPSVVAVGAVDSTSTIASFSDQGPELALTAPGVNVLSTLPLGSGFYSYVKDGDKTIVGKALDGSKMGVVTGEYVFCGFGKPEEFPASVAGRVALIKRGAEIRFADKARRAKEAGAIAVAIFNNDGSGINWTLINDDDPATQTYEWPVTVGISLKDGEALAARGSGTITVGNEPDDYGEKDGTSMACPHVVGAAALLWTLAPSATAHTVMNALETTALDLGAPGQDSVYGFGLINVFEAGKMIAPNAFDPTRRPSTGRRFVRRGHH